MALRFLFGVAIAAMLCAPGFAAEPPAPNAPGAAPAPDWVTPPSDAPRSGRGERTYNLDTLFDALKIAPDAESAKAIEERIWALWMVSGSDTCNLLMGRVKAAADEKDFDLAIKLLDAVIELKPNYTEAWNRRATLLFSAKGLWPRARRHSRSAGARAAPFRCAVRPWPDLAGARRRQACARSLSPGAGDQSLTSSTSTTPSRRCARRSRAATSDLFSLPPQACLVIARSVSDEAIHMPCRAAGLLRGACQRAGHFGPDPLARNDG